MGLKNYKTDCNIDFKLEKSLNMCYGIHITADVIKLYYFARYEKSTSKNDFLLCNICILFLIIKIRQY